MRPLRGLHSWGNSPKLNLLRKEPIGLSHCSEFCSTYLATAKLLMRMLQNCGILKITIVVTYLAAPIEGWSWRSQSSEQRQSLD